MTTNSEDNGDKPTDRPAEPNGRPDTHQDGSTGPAMARPEEPTDGGAPRVDTTAQAGDGAGASADTSAEAPYDDEADADTAVEDEEPLPGRVGGVFSAETFAIAAIVAVLAALVGTRLAEMLASVTATDQSTGISSVIAGDGGTALIGAILGTVSLALANESSRAWTRWIAAAAVMLGILFILGSLAAYALVPPPAPPMAPGM